MSVVKMTTVKETISDLKYQKKKCFLVGNKKIDFNVVQKTCREIDILLLPLYYAWEHLYKQNLSDVDFETHLKKPYIIFSVRPKTTTLKILLLLFPGIAQNFSQTTRKELISIYDLIIN